jgi:hypothetical protein
VPVPSGEAWSAMTSWCSRWMIMPRAVDLAEGVEPQGRRLRDDQLQDVRLGALEVLEECERGRMVLRGASRTGRASPAHDAMRTLMRAMRVMGALVSKGVRMCENTSRAGADGAPSRSCPRRAAPWCPRS